MYETYRHAIEYNNLGVTRLEEGDLLGALEAFKVALNSMTHAITALEQYSDDDDDDEYDDDDMTTSTTTTTSSSSSSSSSSRARQKTSTVQWSANASLPLHMEGAVVHNASFVYRRAVRIFVESNDRSEDFVDESAIVLYNLALAFHMSGIHKESDLLRRALRFYEIAMSILERQQQQQQHYDEEDPIRSVLLHMAVRNNMGQIHRVFMDYESARQCFTEVSTRLVSLNQVGLLTYFLTPSDCDGFVLNVTLREPSLAAAA